MHRRPSIMVTKKALAIGLTPMMFLERATALDDLLAYHRQAAEGQGLLVFVGGEMGIGKTTLVEHFVREIDGASRVTTISCDGLRVHGPLGPLMDVAHTLGPAVEHLLETQAPRDRIFRAVESALAQAPGLTVLVGEDVHWGDEASLDLLYFLGRRIGNLRTLFIATYRDDEISPEHPLRRVLGDLATAPAVRRMILPPLSIAAVTTLAAGTEIDPAVLRSYTGGNPFFVREIVDAGTQEPITVEDAILARASRISTRARTVLDAAATIGVVVEPDLLQAVIGAPIGDTVDACLATGLFRPSAVGIEFRHAAVRDVIARTISPIRKIAIHRRIHAALHADQRYQHDYPRLAYHAEEAGDGEAAFNHAMAAARDAVAYKSHREAAAQYARALRNANGKEPELRATLLEAGAYECYLTGRIDDALSSQRQAVEIRTSLALVPKLGESIRMLSRYCWFAGNTGQAEHFAREALELLEAYPESREMAMAYSNLSQLRMLAQDADEAIRWGNRAIALAERLGDLRTLCHALTNVGGALAYLGGREGHPYLLRAIEIARAEDFEDDLARALTNIAATEWYQRNLDQALHYFEDGIAHTESRELLAMNLYLHAMRANVQLARGRFDLAEAEAAAVRDHPLAGKPALFVALVALGLARARQGDDGAGELDEALELATGIGELQRLGPVRAIRAEAAWLANDLGSATREAGTVIHLACQERDPWVAGELALWLHRANHPAPIPEGCAIAEPYRLEIEGDWRAAAAIWRERGALLNEIRAIATSSDERELRTALAGLDRMGARPDAMKVAERLRTLGFRNIRRGPRPATRAAYAMLTPREIEVLALVAGESTNREIAQQLYVSQKTVEHHVSAILAKLDVPTRAAATARAREAGLIADE